MATLIPTGTMVLILDDTGTTPVAGFIATQDVDLDAVFTGDMRLQDLAPFFTRVDISYLLGYIQRHPEFDWKAAYSTRLTTQLTNGRFRRFTVIA